MSTLMGKSVVDPRFVKSYVYNTLHDYQTWFSNHLLVFLVAKMNGVCDILLKFMLFVLCNHPVMIALKDPAIHKLEHGCNSSIFLRSSLLMDAPHKYVTEMYVSESAFLLELTLEASYALWFVQARKVTVLLGTIISDSPLPLHQREYLSAAISRSTVHILNSGSDFCGSQAVHHFHITTPFWVLRLASLSLTSRRVPWNQQKQ